MKIRLIRRARIWHEAGEIVEVKPEEARFLLSVSSAIPVKEEAEPEKKKTTKKK